MLKIKRILRRIFKILFGLVAIAFCLVFVVCAVFGIKGYFMYRDAIDQVPITEKVESIRSREGFTTYEELPQIYKDAVISVEDHRFLSHNGIDVIAIGRALLNDIRTMSPAEGGSTITQQLMKNLYFTQEKKLERKFAEVFAALDMESKYTKEEIFELYVNTIYFGSGYEGIYEAAQGYYGKNPSDLSDYEAVMLAGLPNAPSSYSLDTNPALAKQRMRQVLIRMIDCNVMTVNRAEELLSES
ncbi:biosynthetic peptidoglycan transglycosylase [Zongyangia sp. HA2173]|uniref:biosynthetic peptidoglycan transglycosylase n=1 Tax=Zongyangia sp. HA2173 TaxID=3133035 RepID=UPI0031615F17